MPGSLIGRDEVTARLDRLIDSSAAGEGGGLLLTGPAGIGKSALLQHTAKRAAEMGARVLSASGVSTQHPFGCALVGQLLRPVAAEAAEFPPLAGILRDGVSHLTPHAVGLAVLGLVTTLGERTPVILAVDDLHWADASSAVALSFLARRIGSDPIAFIGAYRDDTENEPAIAAAGLPSLALLPLAATHAEELLRGFAPGLPTAARRRVLRQAAGNPLALTELAQATTWPTTAPDELALTDRLERTFAERAGLLPQTVQQCLLVAALGDGDLTEVLTVASALTGTAVGTADLTTAVTARLIDPVGQLRQIQFRHPLIRSAIRQAAPDHERRACHHALSKVTVDQPERQAWHRAAATGQPDEAIAASLEAVGKAAVGRGDVQAGHGMLLVAADLSPEPERRHRRLVPAMLAAHELGDVPEIARLIGVIDARLLDPLSRLLVAFHTELYVGSGWNGAPTITGEIDRAGLSSADFRAAIISVLELSLRTYWATSSDDPLRTALLKLVDQAPADDPRLAAIDALVAPVERGASALRRLRALDISTAGPSLLVEAGHAAQAVGDLPLSSRLLSTASTGLRSASAVGTLARCLVGQSFAAVLLGDARLAATYADEAARLAVETGQRVFAAAASALGAAAAGLRGDASTSQALTAEAERILIPAGATPMLALIRLARGVTALGQNRPDEAFDELRAVFTPGAAGFHFAFRLLLVQSLAEAAMRSGHRDELQAQVNDLGPVADRTASPALVVGLRYACALLADDDAADRSFLAALDADDLGAGERARLHLAYGQSLRRRRQGEASRTHLRAALRTYDALGMTPWADVARAQLRAAGERVDTPATTAAADLLTPQELHIAALAAQGLSNRDIAQQLYVSHRTIGSHLYRVFPKLGVTSRAELAQALGPAVADFPV